MLKDTPGKKRSSSAAKPGVVSVGAESLSDTLVIPAKAGIQSVGGAFPMAHEVDSRWRGNDCTWERGVSQMTRYPESGRLCDDREMAEILSDPELLQRLKVGSSDAKNRKGRFVRTGRNP